MFKQKDLSLFYLSVIIRRVGLSLMSVFIPLYLYKIGYSLVSILFFFSLISVFFLIFSYWGAKIVASLGEKYGILIASFFTVITYLSMNTMVSAPLLFFITPLFIALDLILYNLSYHLLFIEKTDDEKRGREIATLGILTILAGIIAPYFGGILADTNFHMLFGVSAILLFLSTLPIFFIPYQKTEVRFSLKGLFHYIFAKKHRNLFLSFSAYGIEHIIGFVIWPLFIFLILGTMKKIGIAVSLSTGLSFLVYYLIGKATDTYDKKKLIRWGSVLYSITWFLRLWVKNMKGIVFVDSLKGVTEKILQVPWNTYTYEIAKKKNTFEFILARENIFHISRIFIFLILIPIFYFDFYPFQISILIASLASLGYRFIQK